jgi:hypothetical protein
MDEQRSIEAAWALVTGDHTQSRCAEITVAARRASFVYAEPNRKARLGAYQGQRS